MVKERKLKEKGKHEILATGERGGDRTLGNPIKSRILYH
jgi:hypothetical protein